MRKSLSLCLTALVAVLFTLPLHAEGVDVTNKLYNADCEALLDGWGTTFTTEDFASGYAWKTTNHTEGYGLGAAGYWGFKGKGLQCWGGGTDGYGNPVGANSISQTVKNLQPGTYVFGAFTVATIQNTAEGIADDPTIGDVEGVYMFANDTKLTVATNNPEKSNFDWGHAWKFNVATTVTDGTLTVGLGCEDGTTASFVAFDNATLFYFGDVSTDEALTQMRQIDLGRAVAAADTLKAYPMAADTLAVLNAAIADAEGKTSVADCEAAEKAVRLASKYARTSIHDYQALVNLIAEAEETLTMEWTQESAVENLKDAVVIAKEDLKAGAMNRDELQEYLVEFKNSIDLVRVDDLYTWVDIFDWFLNNFEDEPNDEAWLELLGIEAHPGFGEEIGQYPESQLDVLGELFYEASIILGQVDGLEIPATEGMPYISRIQVALAHCIDLVNKEPTLPLNVIFIPDPKDSSKPYAYPGEQGDILGDPVVSIYKGVSECDGSDCFRYESPQIVLPYPIDNLVITVLHTLFRDRPRNDNIDDGPYFNISEFYLYDENGEKIELVAEDFASNAKEPNEGTYAGLCDGDVASNTSATFYHSRWSSKNDGFGYHNLQVKMPEGLLKFSVALEIAWTTYRVSNMPTEIVLSGISNAKSDLGVMIEHAVGLGVVAGDEPGFNSGDFTAYFAALENAEKTLADEASTDVEYAAAIEALEATLEVAEAATPNLPVPGTVYQFANQTPFVKGQGKVKNMTILQDSILWWADANPADEYQNFTFETIDAPEGAEEGDIFMAIKNVKTGKYIGQFTQEPGDEDGAEIIWGNNWYVKLTDEATPIYMTSLGKGQMHFWSYASDDTWKGIHACNHNNGAAGTAPGSQGGGKGGDHPDGFSIMGICGPIVQWATGADGASAWYIRQHEELPLKVLIENGYNKKAHHLYTPVQFMTIASETACDYENLQITNILGEPIACTVTRDGYNAAVDFGTTYVESFYFSFDGDVDEVTITGGTVAKPKIAELQEYYDQVAATEYTEGNAIGMIKDLTAYNAALAAAEAMLETGGTDEEIEACIEALKKAVEELVVVMPEEGKKYFIVNAYDVFKTNWGAEMALYSNAYNGMVGWTYISIWDPCYQWQFEYDKSNPTWFKLFNVGTGTYVGGSESCYNGSDLNMTADGVNYIFYARGSQKFAIVSIEDGENHYTSSASATWALHPRNHGNGGGVFGPICFWGHDTPTKSEWYIREAGEVQTGLETISAEPAPLGNFSKGTFDLTGRRVENPVKGLYIIDGQKVLVK
jgi:hypothetical protein